MEISIFGLGYVGCVSLGCLAKDGHKVIGVDISDIKVDLINSGKPAIIEKDIDIIIENQWKIKQISATKDYIFAVKNSEISIIAVGTPSTPTGHLNLDFIYRTAGNIGEGIAQKDTFHIISVRSTVMPGTNEKIGKIISEISGKKRNIDFAVVSNPEFLREGSAVKDFYNPAYTVLGSDNEFAIEKMKQLYHNVKAPFKVVDIKVAELIKYVNNSFHALKISFANEVGNICYKLGIDSHELMELFAEDRLLNVSKAYLKPGFAYGGSCLPKDLKGLNTIAHDNYINSPVLSSIEPSNTNQKDIVFSRILEMERQNDNNVQLSKLVGKNRSYIMEKLPHISSLLHENLFDLIEKSELIVITNNDNNIDEITIHCDKIIYDLAKVSSLMNHPNYFGISW
ncbi:MAG: nucleotide sugar dehydrogenase [Bacteroidia bacterium]|nr:nucleotide sugar dehydrogenase [Bacteroidia bacterium]